MAAFPGLTSEELILVGDVVHRIHHSGADYGVCDPNKVIEIYTAEELENIGTAFISVGTKLMGKAKGME